MYEVRVAHTIDNLVADLAQVPVKEAKELTGVVRDGAQAGNMLARANARASQGAHGKHYANSMTPETHGRAFVFGVAIYSAEYGPMVDRKQGEMSFEHGSRNQKPHLDLARSADVIGPSLGQEVRQALDRIFW